MTTTELTANYFFSKLKIKNGFFIDVGANDGATGSMTYPLENDGWKGLLIEPNPVLVEKIKTIRKSPVVQTAISNVEDKLKFYIVEGPANLHGLSRLSITPEFRDHVKKHNGVIKEHIVNCSKLDTVLNNSNITNEIDFLKIDVEGHELTVLQGLDLQKFRPKIITAEDNTKDKNKEVRKYLKTKGYTVIARSGTNNWYATSKNTAPFLCQRLKAEYTFLRWDLKRFIFKVFGKNFKSNHI